MSSQLNVYSPQVGMVVMGSGAKHLIKKRLRLLLVSTQFHADGSIARSELNQRIEPVTAILSPSEQHHSHLQNVF